MKEKGEMLMKKQTCPSCGAGFNGRYCRACGYEHFHEETARRKEGPAAGGAAASPVPKKTPEKRTRRKDPMLRFVILLVLINSLMPLLRNWGLKLEAMEESAAAVAREPVVPEGDRVTLYRQKDLYIFTTEYDAKHFADGITVYVQNDSDRELLLYADELRINGNAVSQELYCKAPDNGTGKNWLRFEGDADASEIRSVSFRLEVSDTEGDFILTTDTVTFSEPSLWEEEAYHG